MSACWAHRRPDGPTTNLRYQSRGLRSKGPARPTTNRDGVSFHSDYIPPPPTSPKVSARRVRQARWRGPELPGVFRADFSATRFALRVYAGHRPATQSPEDRQNGAVSIPPSGIRRGPRIAFPQVRGPLEHVVAGEGFEPSKLSRWIYSPKAASL